MAQTKGDCSLLGNAAAIIRDRFSKDEVKCKYDPSFDCNGYLLNSPKVIGASTSENVRVEY